MTSEQLNQLLDVYSAELQRRGIKPERQDPTRTPDVLWAAHDTDVNLGLYHALWMVEEMKTFTLEQWEKSMRWLGFVQGCLWVLGVYTIEEMKDHNR